ncbi:MAG: hypothetical protein ACI81L_002800, partial [Verrucomicrobiales bacterium]
MVTSGSLIVLPVRHVCRGETTAELEEETLVGV